MLPNILHQIWLGEMPEYAQACHEAWRTMMEPRGWDVRLHRDTSELLPELQNHAGRADIRDTADLLRVSILARYGGWYMDCDHWPVRPLDTLVIADPGQRLVFARQHGHRSGSKWPFGNSPLASVPGGNGISALIELLAATPNDPDVRHPFGPGAIKRLYEAQPMLCHVLGWPWFFPAGIGHSKPPWQAARAHDKEWLTRCCPETHGTLPVAVHLWANGRDLTLPEPPRPTVWLWHSPDSVALTKYAEPGHRPWPHGHPSAAAKQGLEAAGFEVFVAPPNIYPTPPPLCQAAMCWNGRGPTGVQGLANCAERNIPFWRMEHGFLDRRRFSQCDDAGILHWASWAQGGWDDPLPPDADARLEMAGVSEIRPCEPRAGYVLVLGQVAGDSQLDDSEVVGPAPLQRLVERALPRHGEAYFRPHPNSRVERAPILPRCEADTLDEALSGARLVVTINSNAVVEALVAGVPCLIFGPHTALAAGVVAQARKDTFAEDFAAALGNPFCPPPDQVRRYLGRLACHQYSNDEFRHPQFWLNRLGPPREVPE